jgi:SAM-dependent methyltransferase
MIHAAIPPRASVLDLGCGTGRFARALAARGHPVVAVDNEPAMLEGLETARRVTPIRGDLGSLALDGAFDVILLASHLVNDDDLGPLALGVARRHLTPWGLVIAEVYPPALDWQAAVGSPTTLGPVTVTLTRADVDRDRLTASVRYELDGRAWDQPFSARLLDEEALGGRLAKADLAFDRWLDRKRGWFVARPPQGAGSTATTRADQGQ